MFVSAKGKQKMWVRQLKCQEQCIDHIPYYISGLSRAHFSDNLSRNGCKNQDRTGQLLLLRILQLSSEFNQTIGNIARFLRKSFDLLGEIEEMITGIKRWY